MCMGYGHVLFYARMYLFICVTYCVAFYFTCAVTASAAVPHPGPAVPLCGSAAVVFVTLGAWLLAG